MTSLATLTLLVLAAGQEPATATANPAQAAEPALASPPTLRTLVPAEVPPGTVFPASEVAVTLELDVDAAGGVEAARVAAGAGEPFDSAALAAARRFEFEPGRLTTGEAVPVTVTFLLRITAPPARPLAEPPGPAPVRLAGRLLERGTRRPLGGVTVAARSGDETLARETTGPDGRFLLTVPATGFRLVALPTGHERLDALVEAKPGEERDETFYLESTGTGSETVVRASPVRREITRQVIPAAEIAKVAGTQGDTLKAVLNLPGVARTSFGGGDLILRGSSPEDTRVFLEGQELPILYHFGGLRSTIAPRFLESVEFVPGNFSADYGRAIGGIIEVKLRDPAEDLLRGQAQVSFYDAGVALEGPLGGGWTGAAAFNRSYIDTLLPLFIPEDANLSFDTAPRYYDYQFLAQRKLGDGKLRLLWFGSMDKLAILLKRPAEDPKITGSIRAGIMFHALQAHFESRPAPWLTQQSSTQLTWQRFRTRVGPEYYFDLETLQLSARSAWSADLTDRLSARAGVDVQLNGVGIALNLPDSGPPVEGENGGPASTQASVSAKKHVTLYQPAAFAELRWQPAPGLEVLPGLRLDWNRAVRSWALDPRIGARWEIVPGTVAKAGLGLFQQPPQPPESDPDTGNDRLRPERALHTSVGVEQRVSGEVQAELTGFHKKLDRMVVRNPASSYDPSAPPYTNEGSGHVYGLEATLRARFGDKLFGWIAYTYQRAFRRDGYGKPERVFDFDQPHNLTAVATWQWSPRWSVGGRFRLVSGNPDTPVVGSTFDTTSGTWIPLYGANNSDRQATFHQLDLRLDRTWTFQRWKLVAYLDVQNAYNRKNQEGWTYRYDYRERQVASGLPILPILGVQGEW
jgi:TonB family protein